MKGVLFKEGTSLKNHASHPQRIIGQRFYFVAIPLAEVALWTVAVDVAHSAATSLAPSDSIKLEVPLYEYELKHFLHYLICFSARPVPAVYARAGTLSSRVDFFPNFKCLSEERWLITPL